MANYYITGKLWWMTSSISVNKGRLFSRGTTGRKNITSNKAKCHKTNDNTDSKRQQSAPLLKTQLWERTLSFRLYAANELFFRYLGYLLLGELALMLYCRNNLRQFRAISDARGCALAINQFGCGSTRQSTLVLWNGSSKQRNYTDTYCLNCCRNRINFLNFAAYN